MADTDLGIIRYKIKPLDFNGTAEFNVYLDGDVRNEDTNYGEKFWKDVYNQADEGSGIINIQTLKNRLSCFCRNEVYHSEERENS